MGGMARKIHFEAWHALSCNYAAIQQGDYVSLKLALINQRSENKQRFTLMLESNSDHNFIIKTPLVGVHTILEKHPMRDADLVMKDVANTLKRWLADDCLTPDEMAVLYSKKPALVLA